MIDRPIWMMALGGMMVYPCIVIRNGYMKPELDNYLAMKL